MSLKYYKNRIKELEAGRLRALKLNIFTSGLLLAVLLVDRTGWFQW